MFDAHFDLDDADALPRSQPLTPHTREQAAQWIRQIRAEQDQQGPVAALLQEYSLSSEEGVALLCIAECILRIPDQATVDNLLQSKLAGLDWQAHAGNSAHWFVNASTAALLVTGKVLDTEPAGAWRGLVQRLGEPVIRSAVQRAVRVLGGQFVYHHKIEGACKKAKTELTSFDMLGEAAMTEQDAQYYIEQYRHAIAITGRMAREGELTARNGISIKLSALHPRFEPRQHHQDELYRRLKPLVMDAAALGIPLCIDAEETERLPLQLDMLKRLAMDPDLADYRGLGLAIQAYHKAALATCEWVVELAKSTRRRLTPRLVKGAYWDAEVKKAQVLGLAHYPVWTCKADTDVNYLACAETLLAGRPFVYPGFATHNALSVAAILQYAAQPHGFEFQRLHGMGDSLFNAVTDAVPVRIYAPVGPHKDLLAYLVRRLLENGANSSFVHQMADPNCSIDHLTCDPRTLTEPTLPPPHDLFGTRQNSRGLNLDYAGHLKRIQDAQAPDIQAPWFSADEALARLDQAHQALPQWRGLSMEARADLIEKAADLIEDKTESFVRLIAQEAGRTWQDGLSEVREGVDFLRYYADQARTMNAPIELPGPTGESNRYWVQGKGVFVCIAPWNFPLAIFVGQVSAALVTGNTVLAKPAEATPRTAAYACKLLHAAGIPESVLHCIPGSGPELGQALINDPRVAGVAFTGSTATARHINLTLAQRPGPIGTLIAETGGINALIVDSSALPEQVTRDVLAGAFQSAGQRCSALRVLCLQEDIAARQLDMIQGAMALLTVGDPDDPSTDVGPVIDLAAADGIQDYLTRIESEGAVCLAQTPAPKQARFVAPQLWRLPNNALPDQEVFGPILHVVTYKTGEMDQLIEQINAMEYSLTCALHTRSDLRQARFESLAAAGNLYINRNQIGAVVASQPFGGHGLSGTGPKAGGPLYLTRFIHERTLSIDTTAAGGNAALMAGILNH